MKHLTMTELEAGWTTFANRPKMEARRTDCAPSAVDEREVLKRLINLHAA